MYFIFTILFLEKKGSDVVSKVLLVFKYPLEPEVFFFFFF